MCRLLGVSSSGYYAWAKRPRSQRAETDEALLREIRVAHEVSRGTYGAPRVHAELVTKGIRVGRKRVARLMSQAGLAGVSRRRFITTTTRGDGRQAPDLVERNFSADAPDQLWVADITYIPSWSGFLYLAVVLDAFSRRIVGWSMATTLATQLVLDALNMALATRRPRDVIHHSDQGAQGELNWSSQHLERAIAMTDLSPIQYEHTHPTTALIPTHTSLPSCSRPSRPSPSGGPEDGAGLDRRCARQPHRRAGRDERMAPPGAELKNGWKGEDKMPRHQLS